MVKALLIVESPTKEKTIGKMLGKNYVIKSSYGHIRDLPTKELGVDVDHNFEPKYVPLAKAKKIIPEPRAAEKFSHNRFRVAAKTAFDAVLATFRRNEAEITQNRQMTRRGMRV